MPRRSARKSDTIVGRLRAADPFELIRWLARSQPDPRKALAELVQNSIDAGARHIHITRLRERGVAALRIVDDGEGVIPELERTQALSYIATHIGHSRKRNLTPEQRRELMLQGKYGIGLLGFWAIGEMLEIRTQLPGQAPYLLRMFEDAPKFEIERARSRLSLGERSTEIVVRNLHRPAFSSLSARRISDYLAGELRGQLLSRGVQVLVYDRIARGRAPKVIEVQPRRFDGRRLDLPDSLPVEGFSSLRPELYVLPSDSAAPVPVAVSCAGTMVYDDIAEYEVADFRREPWTDRRLTGLLEFPDFQVPPGSRRGVLPDGAALAFAHGVRSLEGHVREVLREEASRRTAAIEADMLRQLERAFRDVPKLAPEYDFFAVRSGEAKASAGSPSAAQGGVDAMPETGPPLPEGAALPEDADEQDVQAPALLPAGALATLHVVPVSTRVERLGRRRLRAYPRDESSTKIARPIEIHWQTDDSVGTLDTDHGPATTFQAGPEAGRATVIATAVENDRRAEGRAVLDVVEAIAGSTVPRTGIPEPVFVSEPSQGWRSRVRDGQWEVNSGHPDYRAGCETPRRKLRYLTALLAKEVVLHSFPQPQLGAALERLVEVLTITERRLEKG